MSKTNDRHPALAATALRTSLAVVCTLTLAAAALASEGDWSQWGGPGGDFSSSAEGVSTNWPASGPAVLWERALGDHGHSGILVSGDKVYTSYRSGNKDVLIGLDAQSGETLFEVEYDSPTRANHNGQFGPGPHATPALAGDRIFTASGAAVIRAHDTTSGEIVWTRDLVAELELAFMHRGYGGSPVVWNDLLILNGGGDGQAVLALRQSDGSVVWKSLDGGGSYSTPRIFEIDGVEQVVVALGARRAGLDPATGDVLWQLDLPSTAETTMATQLHAAPNTIFTSSAYADGSRAFTVRKEGDGWIAEEAWYSRKMRVMHQASAVLGGVVYASSGDFGPTFLAGLDVATGELLFRQRGFAKANVTRLGNQLLILDEDGRLAIGAPSEEGVDVLASAEVLDGVSWTVPTVHSGVAYLRNRERMVALDLSGSAGSAPASAAPTATVTSFDWPSSGLAGVPQRSSGGRTLAVPATEIESGLAYYVQPGDAQLNVTSRAPLQRITLQTSSAVGYFVTPFDLEDLEGGASPLLSGALRIPVRSFVGLDPLLERAVFGPQAWNTQEHPELGIRLVELLEVETVEAQAGSTRFDVVAKVEIAANGKMLPREVPVELTFVSSTMETMSRYPGELATLTAQIEIPLAELGISIPPPAALLLAESVAVDVFLTFSTVDTDKSLDPRVSQEFVNLESRALILARDFEDDQAALDVFREILEGEQDNVAALNRIAFGIVTQPRFPRRPLPVALEAAQRVVELTPDDALAHNTLARIQHELGDTTGAVATQRRALELVGAEHPARGSLEGNLARYEAALGSPGG